ncbi:MAG TPA: tetratricopeptide repeat protein [Bryobacteraceae bacterium]|nr:tetratricopeptide repeat protein [Bryobacteraceae bacterium]
MKTRILRSVVVGIGIAALSFAQPKVKSPKEAQDFNAIQQATTVDDRIAAADKFVTDHPKSELKSLALFLAAEAAERKNDGPKAIAYAETALEADPKNYQAMLLISGELARSTRENDLDKEEKLSRAEKFANNAVPAINAAPKPNPQITDDQWNGYKKDDIAQVHSDLGMIAMVRKKYDVAITEFKTAVDGAATPDAATMVRLASAYNQGGKPDDAIAVADKVLAMPNLNATIKQYATSEKARAEQAKNKK